MERLVRRAGRIPRQRTTIYGRIDGAARPPLYSRPQRSLVG
jgi:hypothetical protein